MTGFTSKHGPIRLAILMSLLLASAAGAEPATPPASRSAGTVVGKRLIEFGWDEPDTAFLRKHLAEMQKTPFDGCVFHARYLKGEGKDAKNTGDFMWESWSKRAFTEAELAASIEDLRAIKAAGGDRFRDHFLRFNTTPADLDWFDDFGPIVQNARLAARLAREGGCRGVLFDIEQYNTPLWKYEKQKDAKTKSWDDYAKQVRQRGREVMAAFQEGYPGGVIFLTFGYSLPYVQAGKDRAKLPQADYGLLAPFLDGMVDAAAEGTRIVDGFELAYGYKDPAKFAPAYKLMAEDALPFVAADHDKYRKVFSFGFGLWLDHDWRKKGWDADDPSKNFYTPEAFGRSVRTALETADEYVWVYTETPRWWSDAGGPVKLPRVYFEAVQAARGQAAERPKGPPG